MNLRSIVSLCAAVFAGFLGGVLSQQFTRPVEAASAGVVTARDFRLVDASGKVLAELAPVMDPGAKTPVTKLQIFGANHYVSTLQTDGLFFGRGWGDENLGIGFAYGSSHKMSPAIFFWYGKRGRMGMELDANQGGAPSAWMYDAQGKTIWRAPATPSP